MAANPPQIVEAFITAVRNLASEDNYKTIAGLFDEITQVKGQIKSKDVKLDRVKREITDLESKHEGRLQQELELYCTQRNKQEEEKTKLHGDISTLKATTDERDKAMVGLSRAQDGFRGQIDLLRKSLEEEKKKVSGDNAEISELQEILKVKDSEVDNLKESLSNSKTQASKADNQLQALREENASLRQSLQAKTARLSELEGSAKKLHEEDEVVWIDRLDTMWESARQLVTSHLKEDVAESGLRGLDSWKKFRDSQILDRLPLPRSNTPAAKRMRIAALLAILARWINDLIFQPCYILDDEDDEIRLLLIRMAVENSKKESFCRALLLSIDYKEKGNGASKRIERVVREVVWYVRDMLSDVKYESFRSGLEQVAQQACDAWKIAQCSREKFEPYFDLIQSDNREWQPLKFDDGGNDTGEQDSTTSSHGDEELLVIFPRIYFIEDGPPDPITDGVVLMKSQSTSATVEVEIERRKSSNPTVGMAMSRPRPNKSRKKSISLHTGNGFLSQSTPLSAN